MHYDPHPQVGYRTQFVIAKQDWLRANHDWFEYRALNGCLCRICRHEVYNYHDYQYEWLYSYKNCERGYNKRKWQPARRQQRKFKELLCNATES